MYLRIIIMTIPQIGVRRFSATTVASQRPDHRLFSQVNWDHIESGKYAIVDPVDPGNILYLSPKEYYSAQKTWLSNDIAIVVLALPSDKRPSPSDSDKNSPPIPGVGGGGWFKPRSLTMPFLSNLEKYRRRVVKTVHRGDDVVEEESLVEVNEGNLMTLTLEWAFLTHFRIFGMKTGKGFLSESKDFAFSLVSLYQAQGGLALVKRLKVYAFAVKSFLAGSPLKTTEPLGIRVRLSHGLPKVLPASVRRKLRSRCPLNIRLWMTLLMSYKGLFIGAQQPSLAMVVKSPFLPSEEVLTEIRGFLPKFWGMFKDVKHRSLRPTSLHMTLKSGPNVRPSFAGIGVDLMAWCMELGRKGGYFLSKEPKDLVGWVQFHDFMIWVQSHFIVPLDDIKKDSPLYQVPLFSYLLNTGIWNEERMLFVGLIGTLGCLYTPAVGSVKVPKRLAMAPRERGQAADWERLWELVDGIPSWCLDQSHYKCYPRLTRISFLQEGAGKVRNVCIVDWFTQHYLKPMHLQLFEILRVLPTDATFDQEGAVDSFSKRSGYMASYDLTSATEIIPQFLYAEVLTPFFGAATASAWLSLIADRWFHILPNREYSRVESPVRYRRGQPMGALSSWASMALVHHFLVQFAASRVGKFPFYGYRVLGDDIVINDQELGLQYELCASQLGILLSGPKTIKSEKGLFDFACQTIMDRANLSPYSIRSELSIRSVQQRIEDILWYVRRGYIDLEAPGWLNLILRYAFGPKSYLEIQESRRKGVVDPLVWALLIATLGGGKSGHKMVKTTSSSWAPLIELGGLLIKPLSSFFTPLGGLHKLVGKALPRSSLKLILLDMIKHRVDTVLELTKKLPLEYPMVPAKYLFLLPLQRHLGPDGDRENHMTYVRTKGGLVLRIQRELAAAESLDSFRTSLMDTEVYSGDELTFVSNILSVLEDSCQLLRLNPIRSWILRGQAAEVSATDSTTSQRRAWYKTLQRWTRWGTAIRCLAECDREILGSIAQSLDQERDPPSSPEEFSGTSQTGSVTTQNLSVDLRNKSE